MIRDSIDILQKPFPTFASRRSQVLIFKPAKKVWNIVGQASRLPEWFPGVKSVTISENRRQMVTDADFVINETILMADPGLMRFQYSIGMPLIKHHISTIDVIEVSDSSCVLIYSVDAEPATMALVIAGAGYNAIRYLKAKVENNSIE
jgi:hypothetical protein